MAYLARIEPAHAAFVPAAPVPFDEGIPEAQFSRSRMVGHPASQGRPVVDSASRDAAAPVFERTASSQSQPDSANPKLESLRRMAVLSWHFGFTVDGEDVAEFIESGFSLEQYELLVISVLGAGSNVIPFGKAGRA